MNKLYLPAGAVILLLLTGLAFGWYVFGPKPPLPETYAAAQVQADGSKVLERKPQADARPVHKVPTGAQVERVMQLTVAPLNAPVTAGGASAECPALDVDLTLVRLPDASRRVIASSPNGRIIGGVDIPVEGAVTRKELKWAAGVTANPMESTFGAFLDRDLGPFRLGAEFNQIKNGFDARLKAGVRF